MRIASIAVLIILSASVLRADPEYMDGFAGFNIAPSSDPIRSYKEVEFSAGANFVFTDTVFPLSPDATVMVSYVPHENAAGFGWGVGVLPPYIGDVMAVGFGFELQNRDGFNTLRRFVTLHWHAGSRSGAYADYRFGSEKIDGRSSFFARVSINFSAKWMKQRLGW